MPSSIAVNDQYICWADAANNKVQYLDRASKLTFTLASDQIAARWLVLNKDKLYWKNIVSISGKNYTNIMSADIRSGQASTVVALQSGASAFPYPLAVDDQYIYWPQDPGGINKTTLDGSTTTLIGGPYVGIFDMVSSGVTVWWTLGGNAGDTVMKATVAGGSPQVEASGQAMPLGITYNSGNLFWANQGIQSQNNTGSIMKLNTATNQPTILAQNQYHPVWITADASRVFWSDYPEIRQVSVDGGEIIVLTGRSSAPTTSDTRMANDSLYVYWVYSGNLYKVAKHTP